MRNAVQSHLRKVKYVKSYRLGEYGEGDAASPLWNSSPDRFLPGSGAREMAKTFAVSRKNQERNIMVNKQKI